jgi:hypothetical protein
LCEIIPDAVEVRDVQENPQTFSVAMTDVARSALEEQLTELTHQSCLTSRPGRLPGTAEFRPSEARLRNSRS